MKLKLVVAMSALFILTACMVAPRHGGVGIIPTLPVLVELEVEQPYYVVRPEKAACGIMREFPTRPGSAASA